jgi:hypothetical protein
LAFAFDTSPGLTGATVFGGGGNGRDPPFGGGDISPAPTGLAFTGGTFGSFAAGTAGTGSAGVAGAGAVAGGVRAGWGGAGSGGGSALGGASLGTRVGVAWARASNHGTPLC